MNASVRRRPVRSAASNAASTSSGRRLNGFSQMTCLPASTRADRPLAVHRVRERDVDGVDVGVLEQRLVRAVRALDLPLSSRTPRRARWSRLATATSSTFSDACAPGITFRLMSAVERRPSLIRPPFAAPAAASTCGGGCGGSSVPAPLAATASSISREHVGRRARARTRATQPSTWRGSRAPTIAAVTPGWASAQATASSGSVAPRPAAIGRRRSTRSRFRPSAGSRNAGDSRRQSLGVELGDPVAVEAAGEEARGHRRVDDRRRCRARPPRAATVVRAPRVRSDSGGCTESTWRIASQRSSWSTSKFATPIQRALPSSTSSAIVAHESSSGGSRRPVGPVELVEVDPLDAEPAQAPLALLADRLRSQVVLDHAVRAALPAPAALREDEHVLADAVGRERASDDLLGVAEPVHGGGVDPVDAELDGVPDRGDRLVVVDRAPAEAPRPADRPGAEADGRELGPGSRRGAASSRAATALRRRGSRATIESASTRAGARPSRVEIAEASSRSSGRNSIVFAAVVRRHRLDERMPADRVGRGDVEDLVPGRSVSMASTTASHRSYTSTYEQ